MAMVGADTSGNIGDSKDLGGQKLPGMTGTGDLGSRKLFIRKNPGAPGKLGKSSTKAESLSKLRGKGALA